MAEAEVGGLDDDDDGSSGLDEEKLRAEGDRAEREGLTNFANLNLFLLWYQMGGSEHGLSLSELAKAPASMIKDFLYLLGRLSKKKKKLRKEKERIDKARGRDD